MYIYYIFNTIIETVLFIWVYLLHLREMMALHSVKADLALKPHIH